MNNSAECLFNWLSKIHYGKTLITNLTPWYEAPIDYSNKNDFQSKAHLPIEHLQFNLEWLWPWGDLDMVNGLDFRHVKPN